MRFLFALWLLGLGVWTSPHTVVASSTPESFVEQRLPSKDKDVFVVLRNGLTVLIRPRDDTDVVAAKVFVRAGSIYEGDKMGAGLSHYLEHVVSGGSTASFTEEEARDRLEKLGGATNAYTSHDRTVYYITTGAPHWRDALDLLLSYVTECTVDASQVAREKAVIQQEFKMGENNPQRELWKLFMKTAYAVHPARHPVIGYEDLFVQTTREDLIQYYSSRYQPQNMVLAVAGRVDPQEVIAFVGEKTAHAGRTRWNLNVLPLEPPPTGSRWAEKSLPLARMVQAMVGFRSVALSHDDLYALDVLAIVLGEGRTSRLYQRLKERDQSVLYVQAFNWTPAFVPGQFVVSMTLAPQHWPEVLEGLKDEIRKVQEGGVSETELEKAKKKVIASHVFGKETTEKMAASLGSSYLDTGDPYFEDRYAERIRRVRKEDVLRVARRYLVESAMTVAAVVPQGASSGTEAATEASSAAATAAIPSAAQRIRLDNGLRVILKEDHRFPFVTLQLYGIGGVLLESPEEEGYAAMTASLLTAGTQKRSKLEIAQALESVGGSLASGSQYNTYFVAAKVLKEDLALAVDVMSDVVLHPVFPSTEVEKKKQETLLAIKKQDENWQTELMRLFKKNYFQNHPYRHDILGTEASVQGITRDILQRFYAKMVVPQRAVLAIYGDFRTDQVIPLIKKAFGPWPSTGPFAMPAVDAETLAVEEMRVVEKTSDKTSLGLFVGARGLDLHDPRVVVLDVLDAVLSGIGYPGGRLHSALRGGDKDLVYVVHAFPFSGYRAGYFGVITQTTLKNARQVESIIHEHLDRIMREPISEEELQRAKDMVITMHVLELESLEAQARSAAVNEVLGLGYDYALRYPDLVRSVTAHDVRALAQELLKDRLVVRTVPEKPVEVLSKPLPFRQHVR
ncbi:M16 family metallopeptidase [Desulfosoma caldarium]|nr:pitrilysin family protein [Desulfosoma caldarium]